LGGGVVLNDSRVESKRSLVTRWDLVEVGLEKILRRVKISRCGVMKVESSGGGNLKQVRRRQVPRSRRCTAGGYNPGLVSTEMKGEVGGGEVATREERGLAPALWTTGEKDDQRSR